MSADPTDSGSRVTFATGAKREHLADRFDLIPPLVLRRLARRYALGAKKYGERNYQKGLPVSDVFNHALEHLLQWYEDLRNACLSSDDHLAAALWNIATLIELSAVVLPAEYEGAEGPLPPY
jgi:hypothetical protein